MAVKIQGWPDFPIPEGVKQIVTEFYRLLDIYSEAACHQWAELFTPDGEMVIEARDNLHIRGREGKSKIHAPFATSTHALSGTHG